MNSMHDALTEALDHPLEYHPDRPRPLVKKGERPDISEAWMWTIVGAAAGLAIALLALNRQK